MSRKVRRIRRIISAWKCGQGLLEDVDNQLKRIGAIIPTLNAVGVDDDNVMDRLDLAIRQEENVQRVRRITVWQGDMEMSVPKQRRWIRHSNV